MYFYFLKLNLKRILQSGLKNFSRVCLAENCRKIAENCRKITENCRKLPANCRKISPIYTLLRVGSPPRPLLLYAAIVRLCRVGEKKRAGSFTATCPSILYEEILERSLGASRRRRPLSETCFNKLKQLYY